MRVITGVDLPPDSPGGSVELLRDLYLGPGRPIEADVFMLGDSGGADPALLDVKGKCLDGPDFWRYVDDLAGAVRRRFGPAEHGVLHLQHLAFGATPALLRAFPGRPGLALVHGTDLLFAVDHPTQGEVLREAAAAAHAIVVPTLAMADVLHGLAPGAVRRVEHVPWGVPDHLLAAPPEREPAEPGLPRLLYAGRLTAEKGVEALIVDGARLEGVSVSVAAPAAQYAALRDRHDLSGVRYLGWLSRPALWRTFARHDLLLVPSTRLEAFGLVAVEAQACGLPVLYQPVPGLTEVLGDSAVAVDFTDPSGLANTVAWLRRDEAALADLRAAGRRNAARFALSRTAAELARLSAAIEGGP
ncbi:glycosyltransferase family 4 protein [Actinomadura terrae]|uniref:glycosyltransferase family 4 protein n=1 Tax=Actinomadura terrae TaxID=604353 RepID=UPI001FA6DD84|nr:glycosyltransferase family 4 protein [Actinomadura terrae]